MRFELLRSENFIVEGEMVGPDTLFLHCHGIKNWNKSRYFECLEAIATIKESAKANGLAYLYVVIPEDAKTYHFESMLGFEEYKRYELQGSKVILMRQPV